MRKANSAPAERANTFLTETNRLKRYALWLLLFTVCAGIYWFSHWETERSPIAAKQTDYPSFIITNFKTNAFDETGQVLYQLNANTLTHFEQTGESHLEWPEFISIGESADSSWHTTAQIGLVNDADQQIKLREQVSVTTESPEPHTYHIQTQALDLMPKEKIALTQASVIISQAHHQIHSVGMIANWGKGELELLNEVTGRYDTSTP